MLSAATAVTRFGFGARPGELAAIGSDGAAWAEAQLKPFSEADIAPPGLRGTRDCVAELQNLRQARNERDRERARTALRDIYVAEMRARTEAAVTTADGFRERLVHFWSNHFTVSAEKTGLAGLAGDFERTVVRRHVMGRFEDMLIAAAKHPAMLIYLDNHLSIGPRSAFGSRAGRGLNENLAREILELHTLGVDGGYGQDDVTRFAKVLTGWTVGTRRYHGDRAGSFLFEPRIHEPGPQTILGTRYREAGIGQGEAVLRDLARHPRTAGFIAAKLARHFVADIPPKALTDRLAGTFIETGGDLPALYRALVAAPEAHGQVAHGEAGTKLRTPNEFLIAALRAFDVTPLNDRQLHASYDMLGQRPWYAPSPAGWPDEAAAWAGPDAIKARLEWSDQLARRAQPLGKPAEFADAILGTRLSAATRIALIGAESTRQALTLLLMSPDFQRR